MLGFLGRVGLGELLWSLEGFLFVSFAQAGFSVWGFFGFFLFFWFFYFSFTLKK